MTDHSTVDLGSVVGTLVIIVVVLAIGIRLAPALLDLAWQVLPGILLLWLIVAALRSMVKKLVE